MSQTSPSAPRIPGFTFVQEIGRGGFADVYLYSQMTPRRKVAVKVLHSNVAGSEAAVRLNKEADAMAGLSQHQNIVTVFQSGTASDGRPYLVMEYYPKPALSKGLRQTQRSLASSLKIGIQLAGALESAHRITVPGSESSSTGILHRDIKPANILVDRSDRPVLGDFGIAMTNAEAERGGAQGMSIPWSPPESFDRNPRPTPQSDIWSLAATIYALLTGRAPFELLGGDNKTHSMINRIRNEPYLPLGRVDAPASLDAVLSTAMAKAPESRYISMKAFGMALREVEMELHLPPTQMDILDDSQWDDSEGDDEDPVGTSLRPITMIDPSQPVPPTAPGGWTTGSSPSKTPSTSSIGSPPSMVGQPPSVVRSEPVAAIDQTQMKRPGEVVVEETQWRAKEPEVIPPPAPPPTPASAQDLPPVPTGKEPKKKPWPVIIGLIVLAVIGAAIGWIMASGNPLVPTGINESPTESVHVQDPLRDPLPQAPQDVVGVIDPAKSVATFTWTNPEPRDGDKYRWTYAEGAPVTPETTDIAKAIVDIPPGANSVCIKIRVIRQGQGSPETIGCATP
ncbi:MAG: serine/threonine protein kinase [Propionibacteriaceae bacterium]|nr:serine/threonine protein kinase [Propionibacteriaceae bacterium]